MCKFDYYHCVRALFQEPTTSVRTWPCEPLPKHVHSNRHSQIDDRSLPHTSTTTASLTGSLKPGLCTHLWLSAWFCLYIAHLSTQARSVVSCCCLISFVRVNYLFSICLLLAILHLLCVWFRPTLTVLASIIYNHSACLNSVFVCISMQNCHLNTSLSFVPWKSAHVLYSLGRNVQSKTKNKQVMNVLYCLLKISVLFCFDFVCYNVDNW